MRLIDADELVVELKEQHDYIMQDTEVSKNMKWCEAVCFHRAIETIDRLPTIEAETVKHGRWNDRYGGKYANPLYECSECKVTALFRNKYKQELSNYCPNCGAKMDGERRTDE